MIRFRGIGAVLRDGYEVTIVRYDLRKKMDIIKAWNEVPDGLAIMTGTIIILEGTIEIGDSYDLRLEKGNTIDFVASHYSNKDYPTITYQIRGRDASDAERIPRS